MSGWWPWKPKASVVGTVVVGLQSSSQSLEAVVEGGVDGGAVGGDLAVQIDEGGEL